MDFLKHIPVHQVNYSEWDGIWTKLNSLSVSLVRHLRRISSSSPLLSTWSKQFHTIFKIGNIFENKILYITRLEVGGCGFMGRYVLYMGCPIQNPGLAWFTTQPAAVWSRLASFTYSFAWLLKSPGKTSSWKNRFPSWVRGSGAKVQIVRLPSSSPRVDGGCAGRRLGENSFQ